MTTGERKAESESVNTGVENERNRNFSTTQLSKKMRSYRDPAKHLVAVRSSFSKSYGFAVHSPRCQSVKRLRFHKVSRWRPFSKSCVSDAVFDGRKPYPQNKNLHTQTTRVDGA